MGACADDSEEEIMRKQRRKKKSKFIRPFCITLIVVVTIGLFAMFSYLWIIEPARPKDTSHFQLARRKLEQDVVGPGIVREDEQEQINEILNSNNKYTDILNDSNYMEQNNIYAKEAGDSAQVSIAFAGDILFDTNYAIMSKVLQSGGDIAGGIAPSLLSEMKSVDIMVLNNEFPYSDRGTPMPEKQFTFRAKPAAVSYLGDMGVDLVSLANNHAYDYGEQAFLDTMDVLREAGIPSGVKLRAQVNGSRARS